MSIIKFIAADLSTYTFTASDPPEDGFPLSNLQTYYADDRYVSSLIDVLQSITIDFATSKTCDTLICDHMNFSTCMQSGDIELQTSSDNATWTTVKTLTTDATVSAYEFSATANRYWRIYYNGALLEAPYIGNIFLEKALVPQFDYEHNYKTENSQYDTIEQIMLDGRIRASSIYNNRLIYDITLPEQNEGFNVGFRDFYDKIQGRAKPFYVLDKGNLRYMHLDRDLPEISVIRFGFNKVNTLKMKTQLTGITPTEVPGDIIYLIYEDEGIESVS